MFAKYKVQLVTVPAHPSDGCIHRIHPTSIALPLTPLAPAHSMQKLAQ